jgi:hypothetical protein
MTDQNKTVLSVAKPTPMWATWLFRIVFILTGVVTFIVLSDPGISDALKIRLSVYLKGLDMAVWSITRMIGVEVARDFKVPKN